VSAKFDWEARSVTQEKNGKSETLKMPRQRKTPLSLAYSFAVRPAQGQGVRRDARRRPGVDSIPLHRRRY